MQGPNFRGVFLGTPFVFSIAHIVSTSKRIFLNSDVAMTNN